MKDDLAFVDGNMDNLARSRLRTRACRMRRTYKMDVSLCNALAPYYYSDSGL